MEVWFFDRLLINGVSNSKTFEDLSQTGSKKSRILTKKNECNHDQKIIKRLSILHDFHELFIINRVRVSRSGRHPLTQT